MTRRDFLHRSSAALAAGALLGPGAARAAEAAAAAGIPERLGIQLYTVREVFPGDVVGVLEMLHRYGITMVETAGYAERTPGVMRALFGEVGLAAPSAHQMVREVVGGSAMAGDLPAFDDALPDVVAAGAEYFVVPWLPPDARPDRDGYLRLADVLNGLGERARAAGVRLAYHNHDFEFETFGTDRPAYFDFVERLDPALVELELDLYWVRKAGHDPVSVFERYPGRFPLWHVKDGAGPELAQTDIGEGVIDWAAVFAAAETAGLRHAFLEADTPPDGDGLAFARDSMAYLAELRAG